MGEETGAEKLSDFPKITQLVSGRVEIWTQAAARGIYTPNYYTTLPPGDWGL